MSLNVLVLAEDITHDQHIVCPVVRAALAALGYPRAVVRPCLDPRFRGVAEATDSNALRAVYDDYRGMVDVFVLCIDRDGKPGRDDTLARLEVEAREHGAALLSVCAHQEIETWALAGSSEFDSRALGLGSWADVREDPDVKERAFEPFARLRRLEAGVGGGRKALGLEAGRAYVRQVRAKCPEVAAFEARLNTWLQTR